VGWSVPSNKPAAVSNEGYHAVLIEQNRKDSPSSAKLPEDTVIKLKSLGVSGENSLDSLLSARLPERTLILVSSTLTVVDYHVCESIHDFSGRKYLH